jgi:hypothetical protein
MMNTLRNSQALHINLHRLHRSAPSKLTQLSALFQYMEQALIAYLVESDATIVAKGL